MFEGDRAWEEAGLALFPEAGRIRLDVDDGGARGAGGGPALAMTASPAKTWRGPAKALLEVTMVATWLLVAAADDLESMEAWWASRPGMESLVSLSEFRGRERLEVVRQPVLGEGRVHAPGQFQCGEEEKPVSGLDADQAERDRQVGLADTGRTQEDDVAAIAVEEAAGGQLLDEVESIDGWKLKSKSGQALL